MPIVFKWEGKKPDRPAPEVIEGGLQAALDLFTDPRGIKDRVVTGYLRLDAIGWNVEGVGWSANDEERLVIFRYSQGGYHVSYYAT